MVIIKMKKFSNKNEQLSDEHRPENYKFSNLALILIKCPCRFVSFPPEGKISGKRCFKFLYKEGKSFV